MATLVKIKGVEHAALEMRKIGVSEAGISEMASKAIFLAIKLKGVRNAIANILKQECLAVGADAAVSQWTVNCRKPKTDVLVMGTAKQLLRVAAKMMRQPLESPALGKELREAVQRKAGKANLKLAGVL